MQEFFEKHLQYDKNYGRIEVYEILWKGFSIYGEF